MDSSCDKFKYNIHQIVYSHDSYPFRRLYFCHSFLCFAASLQCYFHDIHNEQIFPYVRFSQKNIWISRSNGGYSIGKVFTQDCIQKLDGKWFVNVVFEDTIYNDSFALDDKSSINEENFSHYKLVDLVTLPSDIIHINYIFSRFYNYKNIQSEVKTQ